MEAAKVEETVVNETMVSLDDYQIIDEYNNLPVDALKFLNLSGRQAYHSQNVKGQGIIVAVVDTGVNAEHPELKGRVLVGKNYCKYRDSTDTRDDRGHGTHVAGSIAGKNVGIAPEAEILPVKVLDGNGGGKVRDIINALKWITTYRDPKNGRKASVVSMSLSVPKNLITASEKRDFEEAINILVKNDIAVCVSAGNTKKDEERYPAAFDEVICVGAVDYLKNKALFSTTGKHVDLVQVGVNVISCDYSSDGYVAMSGTSMSTPLVSGIAALIACKHKIAFREDIKEDYLWRSLKLSTKDIGIPGDDKVFGFGFCTLQPLEAHIVMRNNSKTLIVNGKTVEMDKPVVIEEGRFMIPIRFIGESTGCFVSFDLNTQTAEFIY